VPEEKKGFVRTTDYAAEQAATNAREIAALRESHHKLKLAVMDLLFIVQGLVSEDAAEHSAALEQHLGGMSEGGLDE
jgi:hypothetical protein